MPVKSLVSADEECSGGKRSKERLSILLCASAAGEKLKPLVIGRAARPKAFRQAHVTAAQLPVTWKANKKAWMTGQFFSEWLGWVDKKMGNLNRKILLILDNCSSHFSEIAMHNVKLLFLPQTQLQKFNH